MKKVIRLTAIFLCLFLMSNNVYATCEDDTLNKWAENLEIKFEEVKNDEYPYSYLLMLSVPREDLRVTAKDTYSVNTYDVEYDKDFKNYVIGSEIHFVDKKYTFVVYMSSTASICASEKMKTITYTVPKYNSYNDTIYCEDNPNAEICGSYTKVDDNKKNEADDLIDRYYNDKIDEELYNNSAWYEKVWIKIKEYSLYVVIPLAVVALFYYIVIFITKKRSEKE